jgi:hypothetical protein
MNPTVYFHTAEEMPEVETGSASLFIGASVYFGPDAGWDLYQALYEKVYNGEAMRVLKDEGLLVIVQTNAYKRGKFLCRYAHLYNMLSPHWELIDERVWQRRAADHMQIPFSHVLVWKKPGASVTRGQLNQRSNDWFQGVWQTPQRRFINMSQLNSWPPHMAQTVITATTEPDELVVDAFTGTGVILGCAAAMGRRGVGYEIDPECLPHITANGVDVVTGDGITPGASNGLLGPFGLI